MEKINVVSYFDIEGMYNSLLDGLESNKTLFSDLKSIDYAINEMKGDYKPNISIIDDDDGSIDRLILKMNNNATFPPTSLLQDGKKYISLSKVLNHQDEWIENTMECKSEIFLPIHYNLIEMRSAVWEESLKVFLHRYLVAKKDSM